LTGFVTRVDVGVEFFMVLSGFITHYVNSEGNPCESGGSLAKFYVRRFCRVVLTAQVTMILMCLYGLIGGSPVPFGRSISCFIFVKAWYDPMPDCPNVATWFVASLIPAWLLYPVFLQPFLARASERPPRRLQILTCTAWVASILPMLFLMVANRHWLSWHQVLFTYYWPPAQLADFTLGSCVAALAKKLPPSSPRSGARADAAIGIVLLTCLLMPLPGVPPDWDGPKTWRPGHWMQWEQLSARLASPFLAAFLYFSMKSGSRVAALLSHPSLVSLGEYTLEVYLFQAPVRNLFIWLSPPAPMWKGLRWGAEVFVAYLLVLWIVAGVFVEHVSKPVQAKVSSATSAWDGMHLRTLIRPDSYNDISRSEE